LSLHPTGTCDARAYTLSPHDALPISPPPCAHPSRPRGYGSCPRRVSGFGTRSSGVRRSPTTLRSRIARRGSFVRPLTRSRTSSRSEEHTSELQSPENVVCPLLLDKKK